MSNIVKTPPEIGGSLIERVVVQGDLSKLSPADRTDYYSKVCASLGLNPLTKPFDYIQLNGKLTLYAKRDATDQLRKLHKISITITARDRIDDVYVVTAKAKNADGREDESTGAVNVAGLKGDALANALMKAETKAKRRVTLSICGMGLLDESELETIPAAREERHIEAAENDPGAHVVSFGKYKGQKIKEIDIYDLAHYVSYIESEAERNEKPIRGQVAAFMVAATKFLATRNVEEEREGVETA
jgi:hypothetical protein